MAESLGKTTSIEVIAERRALAGRSVIDIGCGALGFAQELASRGASVLAVDPDEHQAALNAEAAERMDGIRFVRSGAESLPADDGSLDGAFFVFSLHHVPASLHADAMAEVRRVLKPDGFLCVIEPTHGPLNEVMQHFHDETEVRAAAQQSLTDLAVPHFRTHHEFTYSSDVSFTSFDEFVERYGSKTFNKGYTRADVAAPAVRASFERLGAPDYVFDSPKMMMLLEGPAS